MKSLLVLALLTLSTTVLANESHWVCMKDGKEVSVKGATADAKKAACTAEKGTWTEEKAKSEAAAAGKGGGW